MNDDTGKVFRWAIDLGNANSLIRLDWTRKVVLVGEVVTVEGSFARDSGNLVNIRTVLPAGKKMFAGSSGGK